MIRIFIIDWVIESIKTYMNTPHDKRDSDVTSSFWAAICVILTAIVTVAIIAWCIKEAYDTHKSHKIHKIQNADLQDFIKPKEKK